MKKIYYIFIKAKNIFLWDINYQGFEVFNQALILALGISYFFLSSPQRFINNSVDNLGIFNPVYIIAIIMILFGISGLVANGFKLIRLRKYVALMSPFLWGTLFAIFSVNPSKPSTLIFMFMLISFSMWSYIRVHLEHLGARLIDPKDPFNNS